jgi:hypothetical protein
LFLLQTDALHHIRKDRKNQALSVFSENAPVCWGPSMARDRALNLFKIASGRTERMY